MLKWPAGGPATPRRLWQARRKCATCSAGLRATRISIPSLQAHSPGRSICSAETLRPESGPNSPVGFNRPIAGDSSLHRRSMLKRFLGALAILAALAGPAGAADPKFEALIEAQWPRAKAAGIS